MRLEDIIAQLGSVSKDQVRLFAPPTCRDIKDIILKSNPTDLYEKIVVGYLTSLCAENIYPVAFNLELDNLDYVGLELNRGIIEVGIAGNMLGSCMKGGKIIAKKAGDEMGSAMAGGEIVADEVKSIGNTLGGKIYTKKVGKVAKAQRAEIFVNGVKFRRGLIDRLLGR